MRKMYITAIKFYSLLKFDRFLSKTDRIINKSFFSDFEMFTSPNLGKKCVRLSDPASSHEMLTRIYFVLKPLKKGLNRGW